MDLTIFALKQLWKSDVDKNYYTNGGFPLQVAAISELFDNTNIICPVSSVDNTTNSLTKIKGKKVKVLELLTPMKGDGFIRKIYFIPWFFKNFKILITKIRQADAVHAVVMGDLGVIAMILSLIMKKKLIVRYCGNWYKNDSFSEKIVKLIMKLTAGGKNIMLATGASENHPSNRNSNVKWIFSTSLSENQIKNNNIFKSIKSNNKYKILVVSRQTTDKGTHKVIQALNILRKEFDIELTVVGGGPDLSYFKQLAKRLHIEDKIKFVGQVKQIDVFEFLKTADFYCFPSISSEGFPKSVIEAISFGIPVLCSSVSALPYLFKNGGGIILEEPHADDIVKKIKMLIKNKKQYEKISIEANNISKKYSLENWKDTIKIHINEQWTVSN
tara:strand:+ start:386 stop:1543 length:1158 start_codon:yes stop_codon:yes gene_type:complete